MWRQLGSLPSWQSGEQSPGHSDKDSDAAGENLKTSNKSWHTRLLVCQDDPRGPTPGPCRAMTRMAGSRLRTRKIMAYQPDDHDHRLLPSGVTGCHGTGTVYLVRTGTYRYVPGMYRYRKCKIVQTGTRRTSLSHGEYHDHWPGMMYRDQPESNLNAIMIM
jgi:hypothetical protein